MNHYIRARGKRTITLAAVAASATAALVLAGAPAFAATIPSSGPLTSIDISPDLNCAVNHTGDTSGEWYGDTACGTLVSIGGTLYGPASIPAGDSATGVVGYTPFTAVSQVTAGAGTTASPWTITTVVGLGSSGVTLTEVDSYVEGQESYRTDVSLHATSAVDARIYRGGDCYLQDSDFGIGGVLNGNSPVCLADPSSANPNRIEAFFPLTAGSTYLEAFFDDVWAAIGAQGSLPNNYVSSAIDNAVALSWPVSVAAGGTTTVSSLTTFSPIGATPVTFGETADAATVSAGGADGYTVTITNPGATDQTLTSITETLPAGFSYTAGSTTGVTTSDPAISAQTLTWSGSFVVPAAAGSTPGSLTLHFGVIASTVPGTYTSSVTGAGAGVTVIAATDVAPITVTTVVVNQPPTGSAGGPYSGNEGSPIGITGTATDPDNDPLTTTWSVAPTSGTDPGAACTVANPAALSTSITCSDNGTFTTSLKIDDGQGHVVTKTATVTVANVAPSVNITAPADLSTVLVGSTVTVTAPWTDPGSNDTQTCTIDWGDGSPNTAVTTTADPCTGSHVYGAIGTDQISVSVTDDNGGTGSASVDLVVAQAGSKVTGGGFYVDNGRTSFGFVAQQSDAGADYTGQLTLRTPGGARFHGDTVSSLTVSGSTATWSGMGRWRGASGYQFTATVVDNGSGGGKVKTPDTITVTVSSPTGAVVFTGSGALKGGNITVHN